MTFRRRDVLVAAATGAGLLAIVKVGGRWWLGPDPTYEARSGRRLTHLSERQERISVAVARIMVGPSATVATHAGTWDPAASLDGLLDALAPDQRRTAGLALHLFEEWTPGLTSFTRADPEEQHRRLAAWATGDLGLHRTVWGLFHAAFCAGFAGGRAGHATLGHPGPTVASPGVPGRPPGPTRSFEWDPIVP